MARPGEQETKRSKQRESQRKGAREDEVRACTGPGDYVHQGNCVQQGGPHSGPGAAGVPPDIPAAGLGGALPAGHHGLRHGRDSRSAGPRGRLREGHSRAWHNQPARNHNRVGQGHRGAGVQCHCLAVPPHGGLLRQHPGRDRGHDLRQDGAGSGRLFLRHEDKVDPGQRAGRAGARGEGGAAVRHRGHIHPLEDDARTLIRHGLHQRQPHHAVQHTHPAVG